MSKKTKLLISIILLLILAGIGYLIYRSVQIGRLQSELFRREPQKEEVDYFKKQPLARYLPYDTEHFVINPPDNQGKYVINLNISFNAGVNGPPIEEQKKVYNQIVSQYKKEAYEWVKNKGLDPDKIAIVFEPDTI